MIQIYWTKWYLAYLLILYLMICFLVSSVISFLFVNWILVSILVSLWMMSFLIRTVGNYLIFPGSFKITKSSLQLRQSEYLYDTNCQSLSTLRRIMQALIQTPYQTTKSNPDLLTDSDILPNILNNIFILNRTKNSKRKRQLFYLYKDLQELLNKSQDDGTKITLKTILKGQFTFTQLSEDSHEICRSTAKQVLDVIRQIGELQSQIIYPKLPYITKDNDKNNGYAEGNQIAHWVLTGQRLFQIDSYFGYWDQHYQYTKSTFLLSDRYQIEYAIIHRYSDNVLPPMNSSTKKAVLMSNPNAESMQSFGIRNQYINFYLNLGYEIILWNYRGYGNSTGIPTIQKCMNDSEELYIYCKLYHKLDIQIAHGISLGGMCAINLGKKYGNQLKSIIVDRTFSDILKVAIQFLPNEDFIYQQLRNLGKYFIKFFLNYEIIDVSETYLSIDCQKIMIFSSKDEIIKSQASLKNGVLNRIYFKSLIEHQTYSIEVHNIVDKKYKNLGIEDEKLALVRSEVQNVQNSQINKQFYINAESFADNMVKLFNSSEEQYYLLSDQLEIDSGGLKLPSTSNPIIKYDNQALLKLHKTYFIGLLAFGPKIIQIDNVQFQEKIEQIKKMFHLSNRITLQQYQVEKVIACLCFARDVLRNKQFRNRFGELIVTPTGHNAVLKKNQFDKIKQLIQKQDLN